MGEDPHRRRDSRRTGRCTRPGRQVLPFRNQRKRRRRQSMLHKHLTSRLRQRKDQKGCERWSWTSLASRSSNHKRAERQGTSFAETLGTWLHLLRRQFQVAVTRSVQRARESPHLRIVKMPHPTWLCRVYVLVSTAVQAPG